MKRTLTLFTASLLVLVLAACAGSSGTTADGTNLEEVYEKAMERQNEINSMSSDIIMDQKMVLEESGETFEIGSKSDLRADFTMDPIASHMEGTISTVDPTSGNNMDMEMQMYMLQDALYMYEGASGSWIELPTEGMDEILAQQNQMDATEQLRQLESIISEFKIEEEGDEYILSIDAASDKFTEYVVEQMELLGSMGITEAEEDILGAITYDKVSYVLKINKDTYETTEIDMVLHMSLEEEDESLVVEIDSNMTFSNFDGIDEIVVPEEVIEKAVKMEF